LLIAHSHGGHRTGRLLQENHYVQGAVIMNPPSNAKEDLPAQKKSLHKRRDFMGNAMMNLCMNSLTLEMSDQSYRKFIDRHLEAFRNDEDEIRRQLSILKNSPVFAERQIEIPLDRQILILHSKGDPWNPRTIHSGQNQTVIDLGIEMGHYPHVSSPVEVAGLIRSWVAATLHTNAPSSSWYDTSLIPVATE
jgi:hypothetical protein